jgi:RHS repeat-associated protein
MWLYTIGAMHLGKDILGSVRESNEYDAFGKPYQGDFSNGVGLGYTGKPYDPTTGLYNYGYRDYQPEAARFTTVDPVRDGNNWFAYVNNDPVNYVDLWGEMPQAVVGAIMGFVFSTVSEVGGRMASGQSFTQAVSNTARDPGALTNIAVSTVTGAITGGVSSMLTSGATQVGKAAITNAAVNAIGGAIDGAAKSVIGNAVTGQMQNATQTITAAAIGFGTAASFSGLTQGVIAYGSRTTTTTFSNSYGVRAGTTITQPSWTGVAGFIGETGLPTGIEIATAAAGSNTGRPAQGGKNQ